MDRTSKRRSGRVSLTKEVEFDNKESSNEAKTENDDLNKKQQNPPSQPLSTVTTDEETLSLPSVVSTPKPERVLSVKTRSNKVTNTSQLAPSSTIVTRKRQMSTDLKNSQSKSTPLIKNDSQLNLESFLNEDNSNSSSVSGCPLNASLNGYLSQSFGSSYKKLKQNVDTSTATTSNVKIENNPETESVMNCPIQGCTSIGHLDGLTERHFSFDACPIYFGMTSEECTERRKIIEAKLVDLEKKLSSHSNNEKKSSTNKVILKVCNK